jgi:hypothetical protein
MKIAAKAKENRQNNKEKIAAKKKEYHQKNKERLLAKSKGYRQTIKGKYALYKGGANARGYSFLLTVDEFATFWQKPCYYCGDPIELVGLDRIDNNIGYQLDNVVSCCFKCNTWKHATSQEEFLDHAEKIYFNNRGVM